MHEAKIQDLGGDVNFLKLNVDVAKRGNFPTLHGDDSESLSLNVSGDKWQTCLKAVTENN